MTGNVTADIILNSDSNSDLSAKAIDRKTKASASVQIQRPNLFLKEEIERMAFELRLMDLNKRFKNEDLKHQTSKIELQNYDDDEDDDILPQSVYGEESLSNVQRQLELMEHE